MRLAGALLAASLALLSLDVRDAGAAAAASAAGAVELSARASISASVVDAQPSFDPAIVDARAAASSVGTSSISSVVWPSFLVDAFFFLYGFQSVERIGLGIAQAGWPQGPTAARATQSETVASNLDGVVARPVAGGTSEARADEGAADARATGISGDLPGGVSFSGARADATVDRRAGVVVATAEIQIDSIVIGPVRIEGVRAHASATPGSGASSLTLGAVSVAGTAVTLASDALVAPTHSAQTLVDQALAATGIRVEVLPDADGEGVASQRGLRVSVPVRATDPTGTPRDAQISYVFGDVRAEAAAQRASSSSPRVRAPVTTDPDAGAVTDIAEPSRPVIADPVAEDRGAPAPTTRVIHRLVPIAGVPAPRASARGAYAAFLALALALLALRPLVRQAARP